MTNGEPQLYARLISLTFTPGALEHAVDRFLTESVGIIVQQPGSFGALSMVQPMTGKTFTLSLWESEAARDASNVNPAFVQNLAGYAPWMASAFTREPLDVTTWTLAPVPVEQHAVRVCARVTTATVAAGRWGEGVAAMTTLLRRTAPGFHGGLVLVSPGTRRVIAIDLWDRREQIPTDDAQLYALERSTLHSHTFSSSPAHELYEVTARFF